MPDFSVVVTKSLRPDRHVIIGLATLPAADLPRILLQTLSRRSSARAPSGAMVPRARSVVVAAMCDQDYRSENPKPNDRRDILRKVTLPGSRAA